MFDFYRPNGKRSWFSLLIALAAAAAAAILAPAYAACSLYTPLIYANVLLVACYGALTGLAAGWAARITRTLSPNLAGFLSVLGGLAGFLLSWGAWVSLVRAFGGGESPGMARAASFLSIPQNWNWIFERPVEFFELARRINGEGVWRLGFLSGTVKGIPLLAAWAVELLIFVYFCARISAKATWAPYSFEARAYLQKEPRLRRGVMAPADDGQLARVINGLALGDLTYLSISPTVAPGEPGFYVSLSSHERSPWGTVEVTSVERRGDRNVSSNIARGAIMTEQRMKALRARLA
ncbi:MAG: hypothetical protein LBT40_01935 [Deltaproteobacteria bacterium]|jgi:hypothetical protein|nr:hypothetical protein [Deltaproteobacteria bacterium]